MPEPPFRRGDDYITQREVIHWIETYKNSQDRIDHALAQIQEELKTFRAIMNGNPETDRVGVLERIHLLRESVKNIEMDLYRDSIGREGVVKIVRTRMAETKQKWDTRRVIVNGLIGIAGTTLVALISNVDRIASVWKWITRTEVAQPSKAQQPAKARKRKSKETPRVADDGVSELQEDDGVR
jgi:hypothetical protein